MSSRHHLFTGKPQTWHSRCMVFLVNGNVKCNVIAHVHTFTTICAKPRRLQLPYQYTTSEVICNHVLYNSWSMQDWRFSTVDLINSAEVQNVGSVRADATIRIIQYDSSCYAWGTLSGKTCCCHVTQACCSTYMHNITNFGKAQQPVLWSYQLMMLVLQTSCMSPRLPPKPTIVLASHRL